jgi:FMN-dependent NADH-azoreductase
VLNRDLNATSIPPISAGMGGQPYIRRKRRALRAEGAAFAFGFPAGRTRAGRRVRLRRADAQLRRALGAETLDRPDFARVGKTFSYADGRPKGLIIGKKATFIVATGGIYDAQTQMASFNSVEPYLRSLFGFLGLTDVTFLTAGGTMALNHGQDRDAFLAPHLQAVQTHAQTI